jgi:glyoxylase-like metal-dependent hydrolase (beta-lactamase superfamily II)
MKRSKKMKAAGHGERLVQITRYPRFFPVSVYLVREDDGFTLIDTGLKGSGREILEVAGRYGGQVGRIALTHAHADHTGSLDALREALPEAEVLMTAREARFLGGELVLEQGEPGELRGSWGTAKARPTRELAVGDTIGSLEVVASPGHTPGHVSFLDVRDRTLITGDAFQTRAGTAVSGIVRPLFPFPALATWHPPTALGRAGAAGARAFAPGGGTRPRPRRSLAGDGPGHRGSRAQGGGPFPAGYSRCRLGLG